MLDRNVAIGCIRINIEASCTTEGSDVRLMFLDFLFIDQVKHYILVWK